MWNEKGDANYWTLMLPCSGNAPFSCQQRRLFLTCARFPLKNPAVFENSTRLNSADVSDVSERMCRVFISRTSDREWKVVMKQLRVEKRDCVESICPGSTVAMRMEWRRLVRRLRKSIAIIPQGEDKEVSRSLLSLPHFAPSCVK